MAEDSNLEGREFCPHSISCTHDLITGISKAWRKKHGRGAKHVVLEAMGSGDGNPLSLRGEQIRVMEVELPQSLLEVIGSLP